MKWFDSPWHVSSDTLFIHVVNESQYIFYLCPVHLYFFTIKEKCIFDTCFI